jgi:hypothetical protein
MPDRSGWRYPAPQFDVDRLLEEFRVAHLSANSSVGQGPPELAVEGKFRSKELVLHVCLEPPEGVEATEIIDLTTPGGASVREKH